MITAVDTNVLLDVLLPDPDFFDASDQALARALRDGALVVGEAVYAELATRFPSQPAMDQFLESTTIRLEPSSRAALHRAGRAWSEYTRRRMPLACPQCGTRLDIRCPRCGADIQTRQHVLADFLIGAHALVHADRLLTRDRGYYRTYFPDLRLA